MEDTIRKISAIFDKMASVKITPTSNYAVHEYWMNRALKGDEKCKDTLFNWLSGILRVDKSVLNAVFNAKYNKTNENKKMNKKIIKLTEGDLHRIVKQSVKRVLREARGAYYIYLQYEEYPWEGEGRDCGETEADGPYYSKREAIAKLKEDLVYWSEDEPNRRYLGMIAFGGDPNEGYDQEYTGWWAVQGKLHKG